jgi:ATP-dependent RNA helicase DHX37/DHR1
LDKNEDIEVRRFMDGRSNKRRRRIIDFSITESADTEKEDTELDVMGSDAASADSPNAAPPDQVQVVDMSASLAAQEKPTQSTVVGGALRRNADGTSMTTRIVKSKNIGQKVGQSMICCS